MLSRLDKILSYSSYSIAMKWNFVCIQQGGSGSLTSFTAPQDGLLQPHKVYCSLPKVYCTKDEISVITDLFAFFLTKLYGIIIIQVIARLISEISSQLLKEIENRL